MAARFAHEQRLQVGEPDIIRPTVGIDLDMVGAVVVAAVNQNPTKASIAHLSEGDLDRLVSALAR
jgi:hypothetical protein